MADWGGTRKCYKSNFFTLEAEPGFYNTYESIYGDTFRFDERYPTPSKQAAAIGLESKLWLARNEPVERSYW